VWLQKTMSRPADTFVAKSARFASSVDPTFYAYHKSLVPRLNVELASTDPSGRPSAKVYMDTRLKTTRSGHHDGQVKGFQ
jgi:hypothetical protein